MVPDMFHVPISAPTAKRMKEAPMAEPTLSTADLVSVLSPNHRVGGELKDARLAAGHHSPAPRAVRHAPVLISEGPGGAGSGVIAVPQVIAGSQRVSVQPPGCVSIRRLGRGGPSSAQAVRGTCCTAEPLHRGGCRRGCTHPPTTNRSHRASKLPWPFPRKVDVEIRPRWHRVGACFVLK